MTDARDVLLKDVSTSMMTAWRQEYITRSWALNGVRSQRIYPSYTD